MNNSWSLRRSFVRFGESLYPLVTAFALAGGGCAADPMDPATMDGNLSLTVATAAARLPRTNSLQVPIEIARDHVDGDVAVEVTGLPADVTAQPLVIGAGETTGTLVLTAGATAPVLTPSTVMITASSGDATVDASFGLVVTGVPGQVDATFGTNGLLISELTGGDYGQAAALAPDGKLVIALYKGATKSFHVRRYDASGQLDTTFGGDGDVEIASGDGMSMDSGQNVAIRSDGTILVAYRKGLNGHVVGLTSTGDLAAGFGEVASTLTLTNVELGGSPAWVTLTRDPAGADYVVVAVGDTARIIKLTSGGMPDPAFGNAGIVTTSVLGGYAGAIDAQARILVAGMLSDARTIGRLTADGKTDTTFSGDGKTVLSESGGADFFLQVTPLDDNRIAAIGYTGNPIIHVFGDNGELDTSFSGDGQLTIMGGYCRLVQSGDALVMACGATGSTFNVYRISLTDGSLVTSFDGDGIAVAPTGAGVYTTSVQQALVDAEGRMVVFGNRQTNDGYDFSITRLWL